MPRWHAPRTGATAPNRRRIPLLLTILLVVAAACASTDSAPSGATVAPLPPVTIDRADAVERALVIWTDFWADAMNGPHDDVARSNAAAVATERTVEEAGAPFTDGRNRAAIGAPIGLAQSDGSVIVDDCLTFDPPLAETQSIWFSGRIRRGTDNDLRIDVLTLEVFDCTPEQVAAER
ncbi:MAG: hypothetical protein HKN26_11620 [Acidimicrobiales bacterium]|nr:hypothetical protein [Acidimicrobiales bacterium]